MKLSCILFLAAAAAATVNAVCVDNVAVTETVRLYDDANGDGEINPGDTLRYKIAIRNDGDDLSEGAISLVNVLKHLEMQTVVEGTCFYVDPIDRTRDPCDITAMMDDGYANPRQIAKDDSHFVQFDVVVDDIASIFMTTLSNGGLLDYSSHECEDYEFGVSTPLVLTPAVTLTKSIHLGHRVVCDSAIDATSKQVEGVEDTLITICYEVKNTGISYLNPAAVKDKRLVQSFESSDMTVMLKPGESMYVTHKTLILTPLNELVTTTATVTANPIFAHGDPILDHDDVRATDSASMRRLLQEVDIDMHKTVLIGHWPECVTGRLVEQGFVDKPVTYCYEIKNTGAAYLGSIQVVDEAVGLDTTLQQVLAPGQSAFVKHLSTITQTAMSTGSVTAVPSDADGNGLAELIVDHSNNPAGVVLHLPQELQDCAPGGYETYGVKDPELQMRGTV